MSHRLSQLLGSLQAKLDAASQTHGGSSSYGSQQDGAQPTYGVPNPYNPPAPYGPPPPQGVLTPYDPPHSHAPMTTGVPSGHQSAHGAPYPSHSAFPQAPSTPQDPPYHSGRPNTDSASGLNLDPNTLEPYKPPLGPSPYTSSSSRPVTPYSQQHLHVAPSMYTSPVQAPAPHGVQGQYSPPVPVDSPNQLYGNHIQQPRPSAHIQIPRETLVPYGAPSGYSPHTGPHPGQSGPSSSPSRITIRSGGLSGGPTAILDASNPNAAPLYTFRTSSTKPQVVMLHPDGHTELGQAGISSLTMNVELSLRGRSMPMKQNETGDTFSIDSPRGSFNWSIDQMKGCLEDMKNDQGTVVARYRGEDLPGVGERGMDVCVPCDQEMYELIVLSIMAGRELNKKNVKIGMKFFKHAVVA